jgi:hypothetical protein
MSPLRRATVCQIGCHAAELTAGSDHDRFDFTVGLMIDGLAHR